MVCLVRLDLVAKEPAEKEQAENSVQKQPTDAAPAEAASTEKADGSQSEEPKPTPASVDALRYMPDGCEGIFWADVAELRKTNPAWLKKAIGPAFEVRTVDIDRITVGTPVWPPPHDIDGDFFQFFDISHAVATIVVAQRVTALEAKEQIEKSLGSSPWSEETIKGVTLHIQQSDKPTAYYMPAEHIVVIGSAKLVREVLVRDARVQLSDKLAAAWARLDQSHTIGLMMAPPAAGEIVRAWLPDDLCNGTEVILLEADVVAGKGLRFRVSVPCVDAGTAYEVRGLCATFCKATGAGSPQWSDAGKSFQFAVDDRCFVLQGTFPARILQDDLKSATPTAGYDTVRSFLPDELCDGIKAVQVEADMVPGKDLRFSLSVPCVDANIAHEVRGLCETFCKVVGSQASSSCHP